MTLTAEVEKEWMGGVDNDNCIEGEANHNEN
jgi:hypothetical protein